MTEVVKQMNGRTLLFTMFGDYVLRYGSEIWIGSLIRLMQEFGFSPQVVRMVVSRMTQANLLHARRVGNRSYYSLTAKGKRRIEEGARRVYRDTPESWDNHWRILTYTFPEAKRELRNQLRRELAWMGFGPLSTGTWISPRDLTVPVLALVEEYGLQGYVDLFTAQYGGPDDDRTLVYKCWDVAGIGQRYDEFMTAQMPAYEEMLQKLHRGGAVADSECFVKRTLLVHEFRKFLHVDPGLPPELLPPDWSGSKAATFFREYYRLLSGGAERFFLQAYQTALPPPPGAENAPSNGRQPERTTHDARL